MAAAEGDVRRREHHHRQESRRRRPTSALPFHLLEFTVISAQGLYPATFSRMRTYASAWTDSGHPLSTKVDRSGHDNPTWNDKFVFRVDDEFLRSETSAITVRLYAARRFATLLPDRVVGEVRVIISSLHLTTGHRRFVALMVRRPSTLQPHGILNLGVALLDPSLIRNMPLYSDLGGSTGMAHKDLVGSRNRRETSTMPKIKEESSSHDSSGGEKEQGGGGGGRELPDYSGEFGKMLGERERKELLSKIEMWKAEFSPEEKTGNLRRSKKKKSWLFCCFCGGSAME